MDKEKKDDTFLRKKKRKQNFATTMESVDGKGTVFPMKLKLSGESFE